MLGSLCYLGAYISFLELCLQFAGLRLRLVGLHLAKFLLAFFGAVRIREGLFRSPKMFLGERWY